MASAQVVLSGYVKDADNGETLIGATVLVYPITDTGVDPNSPIGASTNEFGFYSLSLASGEYQIEYSYIGFETVRRTLELQQSQVLNIELGEAANELAEVIVTSAKSKAQSTDISIAQLKAETINRLPAILGEPDVLRSIQLLPGVSSANEASSGFNVRGGGADQNLILLDEGIIYNASHLFGLFSVFNTDAVNTVKLYKGGIPSSFGGRLSSVLDIQQKEGNRKAFAGKASIGLISSKIALEGPLNKQADGLGKGSFLLAGRRSYADLFTFLSSDFRDNRLYFYDLNLKTNYSINDRNKLYLSGYFGRDRFQFPGLVGTSWGNASGTLRWTNVLSDQLFLQTSAVYSNYDYNLDILRSGSELRWTSSITNLNLKPRISWFINPDNTLRFGLDALSYTFKPATISPLEDSPIIPTTFQSKYAFEGALYLDFEQSVSKRLQLRYGLRWSGFWRLGSALLNRYASDSPLAYDPLQGQYVENEVLDQTSYNSGQVIANFAGWEPRFSANYQLQDNTSLKLGYNRTYQYVHLISNTTSPTPLDIWAPSGKFLRPQYADQISLGYVTSLSDNKLNLTVEAFYKDLNDVTSFVDGADLLFTENVETEVVQGSGQAYGLEVQLEKNVGRFTGWLSYTLSRSELQILGINNGQAFPNNFDQTHELNLVGMYQLNDKWDFSASWIYGSGRPVTYPSGRYVQNGLVVSDYGTRNADRLPAYHRLDLSASWKPNPDSAREGTWTFSVANAYNRLNAASIFFREVGEVNDVEMATGLTEAVRLSYFGIVPSVSYQFRFGSKN